jgi:hypothetical protein
MEAIRSGVDSGAIRIAESTNSKLVFTYMDFDEMYKAELGAVFNQCGILTSLKLNGKEVSSGGGRNYFSRMTKIGDTSEFPHAVRLIGHAREFSDPLWSGIKSLDLILRFLDDGYVINGMYLATARTVSDLILQRVLTGDYIIDYIALGYNIYALLGTDSGGRYIIWYDGIHLTMTGDTRFIQQGVFE